MTEQLTWGDLRVGDVLMWDYTHMLQANEPDDELYLVLDVENTKEDILVVTLLVLYDGRTLVHVYDEKDESFTDGTHVIHRETL